MKKTEPRFIKTEIRIPVSDLARHAEDWLLDGEIRQHSKRTLGSRREILDKLLWFLGHRNCDSCGKSEVRAFLSYLTRGHESEEGRWGNPRMKKPVRPRTVDTYYGHLRTFFRFLVAEGTIDASPIEDLRPPVSRSDQIQPFTPGQVQSLLQAARRTKHPHRDTAIVLFLLDTGCRASELCSLRFQDLDLQARRCTVRGKGNKSRSLYFGRDATKALWAYLKEDPHEPEEPLFKADRGTRAGEPLTRSGLLQLIERLGKAAKIESCRCSPHTFRHTFAIEFLRAGGHVFSLQQMLGHTSLHMTNRYVALAQADIQNQHRQFSPADRLKRR